jgi:beta-glucanase (GH16 family)
VKRSILGRAVLIAPVVLAAACGLTPPPEPPRQRETPPPTEVPPDTNPDALPPPGYRLAWQDEFDGNALGDSWTALSARRLDAIATPDAVTVHDGLLTLTTYTDASGRHHTGFIGTQGIVELTYGYFEARIRFNDSPGGWCAFWIDSPTNGKPMGDPGKAGVEIDVVEHRATDDGGWTALRDMVALNLNWDRTESSRQNVQVVLSLPGNAPIQGAWHVYGVLWTETGHTFYIDDLPVWTTDAAISHRSEYLQLTCEVADASWAGYVPAGGYGSRATSTTKMEVDWVRVWQKG